MERLRRNISPPDRSRTRTVASGVDPGRKRPSIGRAADDFRSKLLASLKNVRRRGDDLAQAKTRYVRPILNLATLQVPESITIP